MKLFYLFLCLNLIPFNNGARILAIFQMPTKSHYILGTTLAKGLADRGHEVTLMTPYKPKDTHPKITDVFLEGVHEIMEGK